ncbi:hypothetical protein IFM89_021444 [Coptis chinensis]|uniref:phospholipase D n=1 Tax=Coptis chinensis TaxID=261450 RepID=A0A835IXP9_9MAGN|nr:hypothetical protein IFM89_021444 [Coptis chinensis]
MAYKDEVEALHKYVVRGSEYEAREVKRQMKETLSPQGCWDTFTHHRCIVVDTRASGNNRKITSFIGGLDLCDGHYDTPKHRLFRDLDIVFANDFHNPTFLVSADNLTK